jgi:hypothetical protein
MEADAAERRLGVLADHIAAATVNAIPDVAQLAANPTSAALGPLLEDPEAFAIPLPEHLTPDGPWHVYRSGHAACVPASCCSSAQPPMHAGAWLQGSNQPAEAGVQL